MDSAGAIDPRTHRALAGASRVRVLEFLRAHGAAVTAPEVADRVGLHPNTVRLHLDHLAEAGLVDRATERRTGPGRPRLLYTAATPAPGLAPPQPAGAPEDGYQVLAGILAGHLEGASPHAAADAADAGRAWARSLPARAPEPAPGAVTEDEATAHVVRVLDDLGFQPSLRGGGVVDLHRCPFQQVAERHSQVVCGVHLGLMQGVLDELAAPLHATRLEPFVAPGLCRAHLTPAPDGQGRTAHPPKGF